MSPEDLFARVMRPYLSHCWYLKKAALVAPEKGSVTAEGFFAISESCYIQDTGHLNAVEFNICYNQLMYWTMAVCCRDGLLAPHLTWDLETYWRLQLPNVYIVDYHARFERVMKSAGFFGRFNVRRTSRKRNAVFVDSSITFGRDNTEVCSRGEITLALVQPNSELHEAASLT